MRSLFINNLSRREVEIVSERKLRKMFRNSTLVKNFYGKLYVYELIRKGKRYYLIEDKLLEILSLVEDEVKMTPSIPEALEAAISDAIGKMYRKRLLITRVDDYLGILVFLNLNDADNDKLFDYNLKKETECVHFKLWNREFVIPIDVYYKGKRRVFAAIAWGDLILLIYKAILVFLSRKDETGAGQF